MLEEDRRMAMKKSDPPIVVEQTFDVERLKVWEALTDRDQMVQWFFNNIPEFKPEVGFETEFVVESEGRKFPHKWTVLKVNRGYYLSYRWRYENYEGGSHVIFELTDREGGGTHLKLSAVVDENFAEVPEFQRESCQGGWEYFLQQNLRAYLEG